MVYLRDIPVDFVVGCVVQTHGETTCIVAIAMECVDTDIDSGVEGSFLRRVVWHMGKHRDSLAGE